MVLKNEQWKMEEEMEQYARMPMGHLAVF